MSAAPRAPHLAPCRSACHGIPATPQLRRACAPALMHMLRRFPPSTMEEAGGQRDGVHGRCNAETNSVEHMPLRCSAIVLVSTVT